MRVGIHAGSSSADEIAASCRDAGVNEIFSARVRFRAPQIEGI